MSDLTLKAWTEAEFTAQAAAAVAPLVALTVGVLLSIASGLVPALRGARPVVFVGTLLAAAWTQVGLVREPVGLVLENTLAGDVRSAGWGLVFLCSGFVAWIQARRYYRQSHPFLGEHDTLLLTALLGMSIMAGARDLLVFFVGLELLSIPLYCLAAFRRTRNDSVEAGLKYFVLGAFGVALFLFGTSLIYVATGTLSLVELASAGEALRSPLALLGTGLVLASLFFKAGVAPFHLWIPDVYQGSPTPVTALMATGTKAAAFAFLLEVALVLPANTATLLGVLAVATMALGNLGALGQVDLKRMLAWSGVAHAGTLLLVMAALVARPDLQDTVGHAAIYYMGAYAFTAGGAFGLIAWLEADGERFTRLEALKGLGRRRPGIAAAMSLFMLSLGGIPATGGFLGKYLIFSAAVEAQLVGLTIAGVLMSVVALGYYLRVIVAMWMEPAPEGQAPPSAERPAAAFAAGFCAAMVVLLGVLPGAFLGTLF